MNYVSRWNLLGSFCSPSQAPAAPLRFGGNLFLNISASSLSQTGRWKRAAQRESRRWAADPWTQRRPPGHSGRPRLRPNWHHRQTGGEEPSSGGHETGRSGGEPVLLLFFLLRLLLFLRLFSDGLRTKDRASGSPWPLWPLLLPDGWWTAAHPRPRRQTANQRRAPGAHSVQNVAGVSNFKGEDRRRIRLMLASKNRLSMKCRVYV